MYFLKQQQKITVKNGIVYILQFSLIALLTETAKCSFLLLHSSYCHKNYIVSGKRHSSHMRK